MIISRGRKYVFVHIPKTGGTALALALEARAMRDDILIGDTPKARARRARHKADPATAHLRKHTPLAQIGALLADDYFCFTLVRNPWDRLVSYYHWLRVQNFDQYVVTLAKNVDFADFLRDPSTQAAFTAWPAQAFMRDAKGADRANAYLRLEHLQNDIAKLESHLGFSLWPIPLHNTSPRDRDWRKYYTDEEADIVARICHADISAFGYHFDP